MTQALYFWEKNRNSLITDFIICKQANSIALILFPYNDGYGVMFISHLISNEHTAVSEEKRQYQIEYVKNSTSQLKKF